MVPVITRNMKLCVKIVCIIWPQWLPINFRKVRNLFCSSAPNLTIRHQLLPLESVDWYTNCYIREAKHYFLPKIKFLKVEITLSMKHSSVNIVISEIRPFSVVLLILCNLPPSWNREAIYEWKQATLTFKWSLRRQRYTR